MQDNPERQKGVGKLQYLLGQREKGYFLKCKYCSGAACCRLFHLLAASWQIHLLSNVHLSSYFLTSYFHWLLEATCARTERQNVLLQEGAGQQAAGGQLGEDAGGAQCWDSTDLWGTARGWAGNVECKEPCMMEKWGLGHGEEAVSGTEGRNWVRFHFYIWASWCLSCSCSPVGAAVYVALRAHLISSCGFLLKSLRVGENLGFSAALPVLYRSRNADMLANCRKRTVQYFENWYWLSLTVLHRADFQFWICVMWMLSSCRLNAGSQLKVNYKSWLWAQIPSRSQWKERFPHEVGRSLPVSVACCAFWEDCWLLGSWGDVPVMLKWLDVL